MLIAIPSNDGVNVEEHFGHCRQFFLIKVEEGKEVSRESVEPPEHVPGAFPAFLAEKGAEVIITGGMGGRAVGLFKQNGIDVILGATGSVEANLGEFLKGSLASTGSVCNQHERECH